ncbi:Zinc finger protein 26 [Folsomia candida]|uniref:Zinc finger protein 26 n=1 Tax=Folsomia candida TaxID=158441 RepID=A0A226DK29_FOLCA|nr:Zinc finger protein 26 [Folsomia candida]
MDLKQGRKWECPKCSKSFKTHGDLNRHIARHDPDGNVKCEVCGLLSKNRVALSSHVVRIHSNRKRPSCNTCHRMFSNSTNLREHIKAAHNTKERPRFPCTFPGCEKSYLNKGHISRHVNYEHAQNPVRFPCTLCGNEFKARFELEQHISTHTTEKPYNCATCGMSFAQMRKMKSHEKMHLEKSARESNCHLCPRTFLWRRGLQRHIRVAHENQRNYPCAFCDKRFSISSELKRHVEVKHATSNEMIHSCDKCEYKSFSKVAAGSENATRYPTRYPLPNYPYPHGYPCGYPLPATRYKN